MTPHEHPVPGTRLRSTAGRVAASGAIALSTAAVFVLREHPETGLRFSDFLLAAVVACAVAAVSEVVFRAVAHFRRAEEGLDGSAGLAAKRDSLYMKAILEKVPDVIYFKDRNSRFVAASNSTAEKHGLKAHCACNQRQQQQRRLAAVSHRPSSPLHSGSAMPWISKLQPLLQQTGALTPCGVAQRCSCLPKYLRQPACTVKSTADSTARSAASTHQSSPKGPTR